MPKILYVEASGTEHAVEVPEGWSVMEGAVKNAVPGIDADCGGACACATCHVFVVSAPQDLGERSEMEKSMLEFAEEVRETSRLACQIKVSNDLDGLVVRMPASQH
ncbi:MAG: 2Fe-2S iron-sulfur cluster-binding protein [Caulobacteraceae bacterium]